MSFQNWPPSGGQLLDITTNQHHGFRIFPIFGLAYTNARLKAYPQKTVIQVASREIFPSGGPEPRPYSIPPKGKAKDPERSLAESKRRATAKVRDIALCNEFSHMFTWTIDPNMVDRFNPQEVYKKVRIFLSNMVQRCNFQYIAIPEYHKKPDEQGRRGIHLHGLCTLGSVEIQRATSPKGQPITDKQGRPVYNMNGWKWGFSTCVLLDGNYERAVSYVSKYISKGTEKIFGKWYLASRGLKKGPDIITLAPVPYLEFKDEAKMKVHIQNETEIYPSVYMISEELPELERENKNE